MERVAGCAAAPVPRHSIASARNFLNMRGSPRLLSLLSRRAGGGPALAVLASRPGLFLVFPGALRQRDDIALAVLLQAGWSLLQGRHFRLVLVRHRGRVFGFALRILDIAHGQSR